ncbi:MAG: 50S ribosomal protein L6 [Candidatus Berkelbacteria bacterium]|nr:50S ribosomal protein L6 [Candidatus Berkelbacteria bacterium]
MSRLGKKPIKIPGGIEIKIQDKVLKFKGSKGEVDYSLPRGVKVEKEGDKLNVISSRKRKQDRIIYGLTRATIANIIKGVNKGFRKRLELFGVGYTAQVEGDNLVLTLGYSHPVKIKKPEGIEIEIKKNEMAISGIDCEKVGQFAAYIHDLKRAEPYKGKGFKYANEVIRRKVGKAALKTEEEVVK